MILRKKLAEGRCCVGAWLTLPSPEVAEVMASCGFDWLAVDLEHSAIALETAARAFVAAERHGVAPIARIAEHDPYLARRLLDSGAEGIIVSTVEDVSLLRDFARHCFFPPAGRRGVGLSRANLWGGCFETYGKEFQPLLIAQIETVRGVDIIEKVAALDEIDGVFLGPYDLSASLGSPGDFESSDFRAAVARVRMVVQDAGKVIGFHQVQPELDGLTALVTEGYRLIAYGSDAIAMRHALANFRQSLGGVS
jgi:2-keto-3-deoxy-L-rhamnonate aldolase RhmA